MVEFNIGDTFKIVIIVRIKRSQLTIINTVVEFWLAKLNTGHTRLNSGLFGSEFHMLPLPLKGGDHFNILFGMKRTDIAN